MCVNTWEGPPCQVSTGSVKLASSKQQVQLQTFVKFWSPGYTFGLSIPVSSLGEITTVNSVV